MEFNNTILKQITLFVNWVSIMKLCTCFSALVSSSLRDTTATSNAVHPAPCKTKCILGGVEVLTVMTMKMTVFWLITPCRSETASHFRETYNIHFQDQETRRSRWQVQWNLLVCWGTNWGTISFVPTDWVPLQTTATLCWALSEFSSGLN